MAFSLFLLVALLSSVHTDARDSQFFNKIPSTTNDVVVPITKEALNTQQEPNFIPEKENGYGLYGHESGQNPPSTTTAAAATPLNAEFKQPTHKYLPKNYNPVAYVTQPEGGDDSVNFSDERGFSTNAIDDNKYNNGQNFYDNRWEKDETEFRNYPTTTTNKGNNGNYYYSGGSSFNSEPQGVSDTRYGGGVARNGGSDDFQPQGLSDTRYRGGATRSGGASGVPSSFAIQVYVQPVFAFRRGLFIRDSSVRVELDVAGFDAVFPDHWLQTIVAIGLTFLSGIFLPDVLD
ncbi:hypothetical protein ACS0TY_032149 [Phlomoides rotata]